MTGVSPKQTIKKLAVRLLAASILFVWLAQFVPVHIAARAFETSCQLACCKGVARHSANSCAGGKCHFQPFKTKKSEEILCGAKEFITKKIEANRFNIFSKEQNAPANVLIVDETVNDESFNSNRSPLVTKFAPPNSCQTDCCTTSVSASQQNRSTTEKTVLAAFADQPRPPTTIEIEFYNAFAVKLNRFTSRQTRSRAPPVSFS